MKHFPKISIITPSYNQGQFIEQTILSVINQNYPNLEYIIIDGGSTDNTIDIIKKYENKITYWVSEKDKGQSNALNKGLAKCTGDIFNWINSDDYFEEGAFHKIAKYFMENKNISLLHGYCSCFDEVSNKVEFKHRSEYFKNVETTLIEQKINQPASFYKLQIVKELGGINEELNYCMDLELWFKYLAKHGQNNKLLVNNTFAHFRLHDSSKTVLLQQKFREEENTVWSYLLKSINANNYLISFFSSASKNNTFSIWKTNAINKQRLTAEICKKHFYNFYNTKNYSAAKFAWFKLMMSGNLKMQKSTFGILYNIYLKPNKTLC